MSWISPDEKELEFAAARAGVKVVDKLAWYKAVKDTRITTTSFWLYAALFWILGIAAMIVIKNLQKACGLG